MSEMLVARSGTVLAAVELIITGCGGEPATWQGSSRASDITTTASSSFGPMLSDTARQAIYLFTKESTRQPECYDACADAWPPVLTSGTP